MSNWPATSTIASPSVSSFRNAKAITAAIPALGVKTSSGKCNACVDTRNKEKKCRCLQKNELDLCAPAMQWTRTLPPTDRWSTTNCYDRVGQSEICPNSSIPIREAILRCWIFLKRFVSESGMPVMWLKSNVTFTFCNDLWLPDC